MRLFAVPIGAPEVLDPIVILRNTASQAAALHETLTTDPSKTMGKTLAELLENRGVAPHILKAIHGSVPEDELRDRISDAAEGVGAISEDTEDV